MRLWIVNKLKTDSLLTAKIGGADKVFSAGAVNLPALPDMIPPFVVVRALPDAPALAGLEVDVTQMPYWIWIHDQQGSFEDVIGYCLDRLRVILPTRDSVSVPGGRIMECRWEGDSGDSFDDGFGTATRYGQYRVTIRR